MNKNDPAFLDNQKRYRQAMDTLPIPELIKVETIQERERHPMKKAKSLALSAATAAVCLLGVTTAYAADLGGIRTTITSWFNGEKTEIEATPNGSGGYTFKTQDGEVIGGGGGVTFDENGNEVWLPADDVYEHGFAEQIVEENGRTYLIIQDCKEDLTDLFAKQNPIHVKLMVDGQMRYFEIENGSDRQGSKAYSYSSSDEPLNGLAEDAFVLLES